MTSILPSGRLSRRLQHLWNAHPPMFVSMLATVALGVFFLAGLLLDPRYVTGAPVWLKPLKFAVSITVYSLTLLWMIGFLKPSRLLRASLWVILSMLALEWVAIILQASRGVSSHFNMSTPFDAAVWIGLMAVPIAVLWTANVVLAVMVLRARFGDPVLAWGIRLALVITVLGMAEGYLMTGPTTQQMAALQAGGALTAIGAHTVGLQDGGPGLPVLGWSTRGGDLRAAHFVGMHALQVLPLLAWLLSLPALAGALSQRQRVRLVQIAAGLYLGLTGLLVWQALRGQSLVSPDARTLAVLVALIGVAGLAAMLTLNGQPGRMTGERVRAEDGPEAS